MLLDVLEMNSYFFGLKCFWIAKSAYASDLWTKPFNSDEILLATESCDVKWPVLNSHQFSIRFHLHTLLCLAIILNTYTCKFGFSSMRTVTEMYSTLSAIFYLVHRVQVHKHNPWFYLHLNGKRLNVSKCLTVWHKTKYKIAYLIDASHRFHFLLFHLQFGLP